MEVSVASSEMVPTHLEGGRWETVVKRVMRANVSWRRPRGRPMVEWTDDGVKQATGKRDISVEVARDRAMDKRESSIIVSGRVGALSPSRDD